MLWSSDEFPLIHPMSNKNHHKMVYKEERSLIGGIVGNESRTATSPLLEHVGTRA